VTRDGRLTAAELRRVDDEVAAAVAAAVRFAEQSPDPDPSDLLTDVYVRYEEA
jgi:pyruvate dehydrogenase E1 component alpha subunit